MPGTPHEPSARPTFSRATNLGRMQSEEFDVVVVGGGITGAGVALDAASRGLSTALVEKSDFASGTSSKSSKLVHGGIRYLQQREFRLVYENLAERQRLLENAPHLVSPLPFLIPLFGHGGVVAKTVARSYSTALWLYDVTGGLRIGKRHRRVSRREAVEHLPLLDTERLVAGFLYFDARADDARLTLAVLRTAVTAYRAAVANYAQVVGFVPDAAGEVRGVVVRDLEGGDEFELRGRAVVNATGVWTDEVRSLGQAGASRALRPAKGVHVTVPAQRFPADIAAVIPVRGDRRSIFVVPWPGTDFVFLGTTDTDYEGPLDDPRPTEADVDYLLGAANAVSRAGLTRADVTGVWAGLRPLLVPRSDHHLSTRTADLSRRHRVWRDPDGLITITGGKLTTYRKMAQDAVDLVVTTLSLTGRPCLTKRLRLEGAPAPGAAAPPVPDHPHLAGRYGTRSEAVLALADGRPDLLRPIAAGLPYLGAEAMYAASEEMAVHLDDILSRRTRARIQNVRGALQAAPAVARLVAQELGWDEARCELEVRRFTESAEADLVAAGLPVARAAAGEP